MSSGYIYSPPHSGSQGYPSGYAPSPFGPEPPGAPPGEHEGPGYPLPHNESVPHDGQLVTRSRGADERLRKRKDRKHIPPAQAAPLPPPVGFPPPNRVGTGSSMQTSFSHGTAFSGGTGNSGPPPMSQHSGSRDSYYGMQMPPQPLPGQPAFPGMGSQFQSPYPYPASGPYGQPSYPGPPQIPGPGPGPGPGAFQRVTSWPPMQEPESMPLPPPLPASAPPLGQQGPQGGNPPPGAPGSGGYQGPPVRFCEACGSLRTIQYEDQAFLFLTCEYLIPHRNQWRCQNACCERAYSIGEVSDWLKGSI